MTSKWIPDSWQEATQPSDVKRYALIELASLPPQARTDLFDTFRAESYFWPLIDDDTQPHLQREGPWLLAVSDVRLRAWRNLESIHCALHAWIESELAGEQLAAQFAPAMVVENAAGKRSLLRFYLPDIIEQLHAGASDECRSGLFAGINRWWYRAGDKEWTALKGVTIQDSPGPWELKVSDELWATLHGDAEVMGLTAELIENTPDLFNNVCPCERPRLIGQVLEKADSYGLTRTSDRRTFAYLQLSQGDIFWESEEMRPLLEQAARGETLLLELLEKTYGEPT
ncbi:DUF4123 domain-containing protein [Halomonas alkalisoli]|uniref:DUF4123 domain-containing protein n=1 Tax=Halomonas alkalisoli TaxID=2907158 RepID=UPI001F4059FB|nr:DUF4123 domain-containing protein [Halomonas alkalisoli]MCE9681290.1 DUF4123 domain-containing protein [Halomonas alkalisoli]